MKKLDNKGYAITVIIFGILVVFIIVLGSLLLTMNNSVKLNKTVKEDVVENIELSADSTGLTLTERIATLETKLANVEGNIIDTIYPVGSIYISTSDSDVNAVKERFPNTEWEAYAQGRTLVGVGSTTDANGNSLVYENNDTGGSSLITLSTTQLPSHNHYYTPTGNITSTFTGTKVTSSSSGSHTHTYSASATETESTVLTVSQIPSHTHKGLTWYGSGSIGLNSGTNSGNTLSWTSGTGDDGSTGIQTKATGGGKGHTHGITLTTTKTSTAGSHTHTVTAAGEVKSTFTGTASNTGSVGSGSSVSVQNPYITVYMYKRTK